MRSGLTYLVEDSRDQKRLQREFDDQKIRFGRHQINHELQAWYVPANSPPYKICTCECVEHAMMQMRARSKYDKQRAQDTIREIDDFNDNLVEKQDAELMHEMRAGLRDVANGKVSFAAPRGMRK